MGKSVTITTLLDKPQYVFIIWNYSDGTDQIHVATVSPTTLKVNAPYEGRVSLNATNGYLTLNSVKTEDSGDYSINVISADGDTKTAEIKLRVLGESPPPSVIPVLLPAQVCFEGELLDLSHQMTSAELNRVS